MTPTPSRGRLRLRDACEHARHLLGGECPSRTARATLGGKLGRHGAKGAALGGEFPPSDHDSRLHARFSWADKAFYVTAGACFLDPSFTA